VPVSETLARASTRGLVRPAFFLRLDGVTPTRAWSGIGRRYLPADAVEDVEGAAYVGAGFLRDLPEMEALFMGESTALAFTLTGVDARALALVDEAAGDIEGAGAHFGFAFLDARHALVTEVFWDFDGEVDTLEWSDEPGRDGPTRTRSVTLNLTGGWSDRRFRLMQMWTPADQGRRDATDTAFQHVPSYDGGATADWPLK
tara:strand:- start:17237 stop:17839 length:603 start_codon:yes stop_codon:yes gene_type:complete